MSRTVTPQLLGSLQRGFNTSFQSGFAGYTSLYSQIATIINSTTAEETYGWLGDIPKMREWFGSRQIKALESKGYTIRNRKFEMTIGVAKDDIEDDKLGLYAPRFQMMGQSAAEHPDEVTFELVNDAFNSECFDGQAFFDEEHPVGKDGQEQSVSNMQAGAGETWILADLSRPLKPFVFQKRKDYQFVNKEDAKNSDHVFMNDEYVYGVDARVSAGFGFWQMAFGSQAELNAANLRAAFTKMKDFEDNEGRKLGIRPTHLITGNGNYFSARDILMSEKIDGSTNTNANLVKLIEAPLLV